MRLFCAVDVDPALRGAIGGAVAALRTAGADAKWTAPEQWHVTMKFLGDADEAALGEIRAAVERAAAGTAAAPLRLDGLGAFGGAKPRVIFAKVADATGRLAALAGALDRQLAPLGFPAEERPFHPHVTLARLRTPRGAPALLDAVRRASSAVAGEWSGREVTLYESRLAPSGPTYTPLLRAPLGASARTSPE